MSAWGKVNHRPDPRALSKASNEVTKDPAKMLTPHLPVLFERHAMEAELAASVREINDRHVSYFSQSSKYLAHAHEVASKFQLENQNLRAQVAELRRNINFAAPKDDADVIERHGAQASKLLIQKDVELREARAELEHLRELVEQGFDRSPQSPGGLAIHDADDSANKKDLLTQMRLPNQIYATGNFIQDSSSEDEDLFRMPRRNSQIGGMKLQRTKTKNGLLDMKRRMENVFKKARTPEEIYHDTGCCQRVVKLQQFESISMLIIALNVVWIGIDTAHNTDDVLAYAHPVFIIFEQVFCTAFTAELALRFGAYRNKWEFLTSPTMMVDGALVGAMILETWVMFGVTLVTGDSVDLFDPTFLRMLRLLRLTKVARIIRVLRALPEIMILVKAIGVASRSVFFTMCLLLIVVYVFAIAFTYAAKDTPSGEAYFSGLTHAMFTLFYYGCFGGDKLGEIASALYEDHLLLGMMLLPFMLFAPLTVLNLLAGILVEVVSTISKTEQNYMDSQFITDTCRSLLPEPCINTNRVDLNDLQALLEEDAALTALADAGVDVMSLAEDPEMIFEKKDSVLSFREFTEQIMVLKISNNATLKDVLQSRNSIISEIKEALGNQLVAMNQGMKSNKKKQKQSGRNKMK